ncbi:E3 ubiquitin-protein ligase LRSAM1-like [Plodia interpunctella]|uniref:E3 ubiquitin-protein ligase LRSAM1-like n=1 Tax=Plodia interpunctella TaxID=58824 RepID=UPI0023678053|nr:E3 ubiquitin-protein ligase LRSAM1-like [Plodia interpunctella]
MGCAVSCMNRVAMSLFGKNSQPDDHSRAKLERKLYLAKESPEPEFDLSDCQLRQVPSGIYSICKVFRKDHLYLQSNILHSLDGGGHISDLYCLKVLNISYNKFSHLPEEIKFLINLAELYIHNNNLKDITDSIQHLQNLKILDVSNNRLRNLTPYLGKLKALTILKLSGNIDLTELCPELCLAKNILSIEIDAQCFVYPPPDITSQGTAEIMKFLCAKMEILYTPPQIVDLISVQSPSYICDPFDTKHNSITWEEQEAAIIEQENKFHQAAKQQRERFLTKVLQEQQELDSEIAKVHEAKELERQKLIKAIQEDEKEVECLVRNFIQHDLLKPEILQQQLAYEQAEHDRLLEITRQNYDNIKKSDILAAMEMLIEEDCTIQHSKKSYEDSLINMKQSILLQEMEGSEKLDELLKAKDQSRTGLVQELMEDEDIQKAIVASLVEKVDARSWSLNQEISLISTHLARLSVIEQEKKKLQIAYNYNDLLQQRVQLVSLLDDLLYQQSKRRQQLIETMSEMEKQPHKSSDFWLKNYQKLIDSAPKNLLDIGNQLDPILANYLLQEGVIHCLPFLVKFLFTEESLLNVTLQDLKQNGVSLSSDRRGIIQAINSYVQAKSQEEKLNDCITKEGPSAPSLDEVEEHKYTGVITAQESDVTVLESECVICMDAKCEVIFIPCGHMCCCQPCGEKEIDECPLCRGQIERTIKVRVA